MRKLHNALVLGRGGRVLDVISWMKAVELAYFRDNGRAAFPLVYHQDIKVRSQRCSFQLPSVLILLGDRDKHINYDILPLTRQNVMIRDDYTCQYCGRHLSNLNGTIDHVFPLAKGGTNTWRNVVAACELCNNEKDNLKLVEFTKKTGKKLARKPFTPNRGVLFKHYAEKPAYVDWKPYVGLKSKVS